MPIPMPPLTIKATPKPQKLAKGYWDVCINLVLMMGPRATAEERYPVIGMSVSIAWPDFDRITGDHVENRSAIFTYSNRDLASITVEEIVQRAAQRIKASLEIEAHKSMTGRAYGRHIVCLNPKIPSMEAYLTSMRVRGAYLVGDMQYREEE